VNTEVDSITNVANNGNNTALLQRPEGPNRLKHWAQPNVQSMIPIQSAEGLPAEGGARHPTSMKNEENYELRTASDEAWRSRITDYELRITNYELRITNYDNLARS
jgi:hypothetical protein